MVAIRSGRDDQARSHLPLRTVFLDHGYTNVIVNAHDVDSPQKQVRAQEIIFSGMRENTAVISAQVLSEFFVTMTMKVEQKYSVPAAKHELMLLSHLEVVEIDYDLVLRAVGIRDAFQLSYWDGLILAAAERAGCDTLYSEDLSHGQEYAGIRCINPVADDSH